MVRVTFAETVLVVALAASVLAGCVDARCTLNSATVCGYVSDSLTSSITWIRTSDSASLTLSWMPAGDRRGLCAGSCYYYSFQGAQDEGSVYEIDSSGVMIFYGMPGGRYVVSPVAQSCPVAELNLACASGETSCLLMGEYTRREAE
jgi:hypothetical protein